MRASRFLAILAIALAPFTARPAQGETVRLLSGEHESFTRLVLVLEKDSSWRLGRTNSGYALELARPGVAVDLSTAFDLIPRERVKRLAYSRDSQRLEITSDCPCHIAGFQIGGRTIVLDIADGPAPPGHPHDGPIDTTPPPTAAPPSARILPAPPEEKLPRQARIAEQALPPLLSARMRRRYDRPLALPERRGAVREPPPPSTPQISPARPSPERTDPFREAEQRQRIATIEAELLKQLARAGSQGMVAANPEFGASAPNGSSPRDAPRVSPHPVENIDAITGVDRAMPQMATPEPDARRACLPAEDFRFLAADPGREPHQLIARPRTALLQEFDAPDVDAAQALTRAYLALGFGAEARQVVERYLSGTEGAAFYSSIASVLDADPDVAGPALVGQANCPGPVSFWALLAGPVPASVADSTARDVIAAASDLPVHLRRWLVPRLAQKLLGKGHSEIAASLRDTLSRTEGDHGSDYRMMQAALAERGDVAAGGDSADPNASRQSAVGLLEEVARTNDPAAPEALLEIIRLHEQRGQVLSPERFELAEALIFEHRGTGLARAFHVALAPAHARDGAFSKAFAHLEQAAALPPPAENDPLPEARSLTSRILARAASHEDFLRILFDPAQTDLGARTAPEAAYAIAERLLALGFPKKALDQSDTLPPEPKYRLMRVRALMALGHNQRALASLAGLQGRQSDALRGELLTRLGEAGRAHVLSRVAGDEAAARRSAWISGSPLAIGQSGSEAEAAFARATAVENAPAPPPQASLTEARSLLDEIRQRRGSIETLLKEKSESTGPVPASQESPATAPET